MPLKFLLAILALAAGLTPAGAADLAAHSRLGAVFAEPPVVVRGAAVVRNETVVVVDPGFVRNSPRVAGYYGEAGDFHYRNYYGTKRPWLGQYLPYACVLEALC